MEIRYQLTPKDYNALARYWGRRHNRLLGLPLGWIKVGAVLLVAALLALLSFTLTKAQLISLLLMVLPVVLALLLMVWLLQLVMTRSMASAQGAVSIRIAPEGLHHADPTTQSLTAWTAIEHLGRTADHIFVLFGKDRGLVIPRHAFTGPAEDAAAFEAMRGYLPGIDVDDTPSPPRHPKI